MTYRLSFRIRRQWFEAIREGTKCVEVRAYTPFWSRRAKRALDTMGGAGVVVATFVCGKAVHRRRVRAVFQHESPIAALGYDPEEPTLQGRCWAFMLGEVLTDG